MKLARVSDSIASAPVRILEGTSLIEAKRLMEEKRSDVLMVVDDRGGFLGVIQFEDLMNKGKGNVREVMDQDVPTVSRNGEIRSTLEMMLKESRVWLPVVGEGNCLEGIVTMTHFACFFTQEARGPGEVS
jgi:Mg/Co/Ni transporter MgtE